MLASSAAACVRQSLSSTSPSLSLHARHMAAATGSASAAVSSIPLRQAGSVKHALAQLVRCSDARGRSLVLALCFRFASRWPVSCGSQHGPIGTAVVKRLTAAFSPAVLEIENESHRHSVPPNSETHFKVFIVSSAFDGVPVVKRHRMVNEQLADYLALGRAGGGIHALSVRAKTPAQLAKLAAVEGESMLHDTPGCKGGSLVDMKAEAEAAARG